jgi:hypothetical protein
MAVFSNLGEMQVTLKTWEREQFGSVRGELQHLCHQLEETRRRSLQSGPTHAERAIMRRMAKVLAREEEMEKQRSHVEWLQAGDRNTDFFC